MSPFDDEDKFESAQFLLAGVEADIPELKKLIDTYFGSDPYAVRKYFNPKEACDEVKLIFKDVPPRIRYLTATAIKNLRDALDQSVWGASCHITGKRCRNTHFPFGESPDDFEVALKKGRCSDIPEYLYPTLRRFEPYPTSESYEGGNNPLRLLGRVSGANKHRITLRACPQMQETTISNFNFGFGAGGGNIFPFLNGKRKKGEYTLVTFGAGGHVNFDLAMTAYIAFSNSELADAPVLEFLEACLISVRHIVQAIESAARSFETP